jgi:hypothetical protein
LSKRAKIWIAIAVVAFIAVALIDTYLRKGPKVGSADMNLHNEFGIPSPPRGTPYRPLADKIVIIGSFLAGLGGLVLAIVDWARTRNVLPITIVLSSLFIVVTETFVDVLGGVYMVEGTQHFHVFTMLGRGMGLFILAGWFSYGPWAYLIFKVLCARPKTKFVWGMLGLAAIGDVVAEEILLPFGPYHYYGNQPLVLIHLLPWWWIPCNSIGVFLAAAIAYRYRTSLTGWKSLAMFVIMPISVMGVYGLIAMPSFIAVNGDYSWLFTQILGLMTIALGVVVFCAILHLILQRRPFDMNYVPPVEAAPEAAVERSAGAPQAPQVPAGDTRTVAV